MKKFTHFLLRGVLGIGVLMAGIILSDSKGWFDAPIDANPHILKRWKALKNMKEQGQDVDVLILGNSHAYTGINPKHMSARLGMTSFVLANNSSIWTDSYWTLREALLWCTPQVVVIETYGLNNQGLGGERPVHLVNQIRAFDARSDLKTKLVSTPDLFDLEDMPKAWSQTIRNHHYLWENREQIAANVKRGTPMPGPKVNDLYLGRFVRFTSGLTSENLAAYDSIPVPVEGVAQVVHPRNREAARWITELCDELGIKLMVVTLPMHSKHVSDPEIWAGYLGEVVESEMNGAPWLNLQLDSSYVNNPDYFENTLKANQHMTYRGSIAASKDIAQVILDEWEGELDRRNNDSAWVELFHQEEGFYAYNIPDGSIELEGFRLLANEMVVGELSILDAAEFTNKQSGENKFLQFRLDATSSGESIQSGSPLLAQFTFRVGEGKVQRAVIDLRLNRELSTDDVFIYQKLIVKDAELLKLEAVAI
jgi:hypothetical protein